MPSVQYTVVWRLEMSDKKSPPPKEKIFTTVKTPQSDGRTLKRKLVSPGSPSEDDDKRSDRTPKRKRASIGLESAPIPGSVGPNKTPTHNPRLNTPNVPLSERQQVAMIIRMNNENSQDSSPKHQSQAPHQLTPGKRTPGDKKVHKRNERGETQLHIAAKKGDVKLTKKLIKAGADVNVNDFAGWTALHEACNHGCFAVAKQLIKAGANVNVQGLDKDTPLHDASVCGHRKLVELLLKNGANPLQANSKGKTPVDVAYSQEIEKLLRKEIISSSSESSSLDEGPSITSPESTGRDDDHHVEMTEFGDHIPTRIPSGCMTTTTSRSNNVVTSLFGDVSEGHSVELPFSASHYSSSHYGSDIGLPSVARRVIPKSPEGKTNSPRLCLKFRPNDGVNSESSELTKDWGRPQYKSYSVTLETGDRKGSPAHSASSSNGSDLYDLDSGARLKYSDTLLHTRNNGEGRILLNPGLVDRPLADIGGFKMFDLNNTGGVTTHIGGHSPKPPLVSIKTGPFSPEFEDISDTEQDLPSLPPQPVNKSTDPPPITTSSPPSDLTRIPVIRTSTDSDVPSKDNASQAASNQPRHRSSSFVTSSKEPIIDSTSEEHQRTRHNSAPDNKKPCTTSLTSESSGTVNKTPDSLQTDPLEILTSQLHHWKTITSSPLPSIPKIEPSVSVSVDQCNKASVILTDSNKESNRTFFSSNSDNIRQPFKMDFKYSSPKVPPLKIILPTKASSSTGQADRSGSPFTNQQALPYVVNPSSTTEADPGAGSLSQDTSQASSTASSRPSSRGSSPSDSQGKVDIGNILDRLTSQAEEEAKEAQKESEAKAQQATVPESCVIEEENKTVKSEETEKTTMVLRDRDKLKEGDSSSKDKEQTNGKETEKEQKDSKEQKDVRPTTRTLRSHTLRSQQQNKNETQDSKNSTQNDTAQDETPQPVQKAENDTEENLTNRKRKLRPKPDTTSSDSMPLPPVQYEKPPNPYELFLSIRNLVENRRNNLVSVPPKAPQGYKDFKIVNCSYVLHGNSASRLAVPMLTPPNSVTGPIRDLFVEQEKARYKLRLQHIVEREKLMISAEQEVIRVHGRAARASINQSLPLGVCTILKDEEIYNIFEVEERDKNVRTRYNGRQFLSWYHDVVDKFDKMKNYLLLRHHHEAESLFAVQKMDWEWKLKELGLCDSNTTPSIDELHVPMVQVNEEFDLLPV